MMLFSCLMRGLIQHDDEDTLPHNTLYIEGEPLTMDGEPVTLGE